MNSFFHIACDYSLIYDVSKATNRLHSQLRGWCICAATLREMAEQPISHVGGLQLRARVLALLIRDRESLSREHNVRFGGLRKPPNAP